MSCKARILVVDDDEAMAEAVTMALEGEGYGVCVVHSGAEALQTLQGQQVDAVLCDLTMPGMSGLQTIAAIRHSAPGLPIIVTTGYASAATFAECRHLGAATILLKPYALEAVCNVITGVLHNGA